MGPACVKKAREKRMKEEKEKVSDISFCLDIFAAITISITITIAISFLPFYDFIS